MVRFRSMKTASSFRLVHSVGRCCFSGVFGIVGIPELVDYCTIRNILITQDTIFCNQVLGD